jgi:hypothetical protein
MPGKTKYLTLTTILLLVALGAGAALASGGSAGPTPTTPVVSDEDHGTDEETAESGEIEDVDEPGDVDAPGQDEAERAAPETDDAAEPPHSGDVAEDSAEGPDRTITGTDLARASKAALEYLGGGRVTATEVGDEESYYEVEVTLADGSQIDVQLDEGFNVVGTD